MTRKMLLLACAIMLSSCEKNEDSIPLLSETPDVAPNDVVSATASVGSGVMMQAFYWNVPSGGNWWNTVASKIPAWSSAGIDAIWLPPANKALNGPFSMGYDPYDYYDFGNFNQKGSTETRFGSKAELQALISAAHNKGINVIADIVINHNSGGDSEFNIFTNSYTYTDYSVASGLFNRSAYDFHPNDYQSSDSGVFGGFADLSHVKPYVQDWLWKRSNSVAKYYKNTMGFDGWRFDYVKGFDPWVVKEWQKAVGGFTVGELWDGNAATLDWWSNAANASAFDFACYYKMRDAFVGNNLYALNGDMLLKRNGTKAVTFVTNHDTDEITTGKLMAYAYILTHEGYPTIFYSDYESQLDKNKMNNLIWIHNNKASGSTSTLHVDTDEYIAQRNGNPGLVVYINNSNYWQERSVYVKWKGTRIKDFSGNSSWEPVTQSNGWVKLQAPPKGYTVWSAK